MKAPKSEFGELERAVMNLMWSTPSLTAEQVREKLDRGLKEATVRTVLRRLEDKDLVKHQVENRTFIYSASEPRRKVAARAVKRIVDWFCDGSVDEVLVGMVDAEMVDKAQLEKLRTLVEQAASQPKKRSSTKK